LHIKDSLKTKTQFGPIIVEGVCSYDKKTRTLSNGNYDLKSESNKIYYKSKGHSAFKEARIKDNVFYDDNDNKIGIVSFRTVYDEINKCSEFMYETSYYKIDDVVYQVSGNTIIPFGYEFYSNEYIISLA
jgi:hypothetical protein